MRLGTNTEGNSGSSSLPMECFIAISHALTADNTLSLLASVILLRACFDNFSGSETIQSQQ